MNCEEKIEEFKTLIVPELTRQELEERIVKLYAKIVYFEYLESFDHLITFDTTCD